MGKNNSDITIGAIVQGKDNTVNVGEPEKPRCIPCEKGNKISYTVNSKTYCHDCIENGYKQIYFTAVGLAVLLSMLYYAFFYWLQLPKIALLQQKYKIQKGNLFLEKFKIYIPTDFKNSIEPYLLYGGFIAIIIGCFVIHRIMKNSFKHKIIRK